MSSPTRWPLAKNFALLAAVAALALMLLVWRAAPTAFDNYVYLADAWKHGRNWINFPGDWIDAMPYHGHAYIIEGPLPAILLFPAVVFFGTNANQTLLDNFLGALSVYAAWRLCDRIGLDRLPALAATAFVFFGTSLFVCSTRGDVWMLGHVAGFCFSLLALCETFGRKRPWLVAVWALAAAFSRLPFLAELPFYLALLLHQSKRPKAILRSFSPPALAALVLWAGYNWSRWGTLYDRGYELFYRIMDVNSRANPAEFSLSYLPHQIAAYFWNAPKYIAGPPWIVPPLFGMNIICTSLPFVYALFAGIGFETLVLWAATLATAIPAFTYYGAGDVQYGARHALDFEPFLFALLVIALKRRPSRAMSIAMPAFAAFGLYEGLIWLLAPQLTQ
jgi:hypothetical protein